LWDASEQTVYIVRPGRIPAFDRAMRALIAIPKSAVQEPKRKPVKQQRAKRKK
jgi:hypothetical protein